MSVTAGDAGTAQALAGGGVLRAEEVTVVYPIKGGQDVHAL